MTQVVSAYAVYLQTAVKFARERFDSLFDEAELRTLSSCIELSENAQCLLSRIILRKQIWMKASTFKSYIYNNVDVNEIASCLQELKELQMIDFLTGSTAFSSVWEAVTACFNADDLSILDRTITNNKTKINGKMNLLNHIYKSVSNQKTVFGAPLSDRVGKVVCDYCKKVTVIPQLYMIVRVTPDVLQLIRRCQRLLQISTSIATYSPSASGTISMLQPIEYNVPLLVAFNKVRFPKYNLDFCDAVKCDDDRNCVAQITPVFPTRRQFLQWESACELRYTAEMITLQQPANAFNKYKLANLARSVYANISQALVQFNSSAFSAAFLTADTQLSSFLLSASHLDCISMTSTDYSCETVDILVSRILTTLMLYAPLCLVSYIVEQCQEENNSTRREDYWIKFDAGTQLAYLACESAAYFEKGGVTRDYSLAICIYEMLLRLPYLQHRRGFWYKRLALDYDHLKLPRCALRAAYRGVLDEEVLISDRTELLVKLKALTAKVVRVSAVTTAAAHKAAKESSNVSGGGKRPARRRNKNGNKVVSSPYMNEDEEILTSTATATAAGGDSIGGSDYGGGAVNYSVTADFLDVPPNDDRHHLLTLNSQRRDSDSVDLIPALIVQSVVAKLEALSVSGDDGGGDSNGGDLGNAAATAVKIKSELFSISMNGSRTTGSSSSNNRHGKTNYNSGNGGRNTCKVKEQPSSTTASLVRSSWSCVVCTYINTRYTASVSMSDSVIDSDTCEMCTSDRPKTNAPAVIVKTESQPMPSLSLLGAMGASTTKVKDGVTKVTKSSEGRSNCTVIDLLSDSDDDDDNDENDDEEEVQCVSGADCKQLNSESPMVVDLDMEGVNSAAEEEAANKKQSTRWKYSRIIAQYAADLVFSTGTPKLVTSGGGTLREQLNLVGMDTQNQSSDESAAFNPRLLSSLGISVENTVTSTSPTVADTINVDTPSFCGDPCMDAVIATSTLAAFPTPTTFTVHGRRFGDPSRKGKNKFCGVGGELVSVEAFVLQKCYTISEDDANGVTRSRISPSTGLLEREEPVVVLAAMSTSFNAGNEIGAVDISLLGDNNGDEDNDDGDDGDDGDEMCVVENQELATAASKTSGKTKTPKVRKADREIDLSAYLSVVDGGGWQGWHCEGSPVKTLFGLLFWDVLFDCSADKESGSADGLNACTSRTVFVTPYQDCPLDLGYPSFIQKRQATINQRLSEISSYTIHDILTTLSTIYRGHYNQTCRGVSWAYSLNVLQLIAVCMGAKGLAAVCRVYATDYKQFSAGAPDLLLLRVSRKRMDDCTDGEQTPLRDRQFINLSEILGPDWAKLGDFRDDSSSYDDLRNLTRETTSSGGNGGSGNDSGNGDGNGGGAGRWNGGSKNVSSGIITGGGTSGGGAKKARFDSDAVSGGSNTMVDMTVLDDFEEEVDEENGDNDDEDFTDLLGTEPTSALKDSHSTAAALVAIDPYVYTGPDLDLSTLYTTTDNTNTNSGIAAESAAMRDGSAANYESFLSHLHFETLFVEVKGPTDHLAYKQLLWLHVLSQKSHGMKAAICLVRE